MSGAIAPWRRWDLRFGAAVAAVLGIALALRLWGIRSGLPWVYNIDEVDHFVPRAVKMVGGNLEPSYWGNPSAFTYLLAALYRIWFGGQAAVDHAFGKADPSEVWVLARVACAILGTLAVWLLYRAGARLFDRRTGLLAAAVMAVAFLPVFYSKLALNDVPALVGVCLSLWGAAGVLREGRRRDYAFAGIGLGLAAATKYTGGVVALPLLAAALARAPGGGWRRALPLLALSAVLALATFIALNPYALADWHAFTQGLIRQSAESSAGSSKLGLTHGSGIVYYLWSLTWGVGWVPSIVAVVGALALALLDRRAFGVLVPALVAYLIFMGLEGRYFGRWLMPIVPIVCLLAAYAAIVAADLAAQRWRPAGAVLLAVAAASLCVQGALASIHSGVVDSRDDTRALARAWLVAHVPKHTKIVVEPFVTAGWWLRWRAFPIFITHRAADGRLGEYAGTTVTREDFERTLSPGLIDVYERDRYCWVVTASIEQGRAEVSPAAVPAAVAYYAALAARGERVFQASPYSPGARPVVFNFDWSFDYYPGAYARPGPVVTVYRLRGGRCAHR